MITALSIGVSGLRAASARLNASASNIANVSTTGAMPGTAGATPDIDLASELIDVLQARLQFKASARVIRAASDTERSVINLLA